MHLNTAQAPRQTSAFPPCLLESSISRPNEMQRVERLAIGETQLHTSRNVLIS